MIPRVDIDFNDNIDFDFEVVEHPHLTWGIDIENNRLFEYIDGVTAIEQSAYLILYTERFEWIIHGWNYGIELLELFGEPTELVIPEVERRITEALLQDERIIRVFDFKFNAVKDTLDVEFTIESILGEFDFNFKEVLS